MPVSISGLQKFLDDALQDRPELQVLEAGCGSASHLHFEQPTHQTGIDISEQQLQRNSDLDERVLGDIQYFDFQSRRFDVIVCWDVLEHLPNPELALEKFVEAIKEGGLIVLKLPNLLSVKGLLTKYLPHRAHVGVYRYLYGYRNAGSPDVGPFKTYLRCALTPNSIKAFALHHGLTVAYLFSYDVAELSYFLRKDRRAWLARKVYVMLTAVGRFVTGGLLGDSELIIVLRG
jgi:SAM-dependent methyltransferase